MNKPMKLACLLGAASATAMMGNWSFAEAQEVETEDADQRLGVVTVTGLRQSIRDSKELKRNSDIVIDAITSEDIGQFTDDSITDAIERIPGVQVERDEAGTSGDRISIRGLGSQFVTTTVNGRGLLTSGTEGLSNLRSADMGAFPAEIVSGVEVQKTASADRSESGLAGSVNILTLRPLDSRALRDDTFFANFTLRGEQAGVNDDEGYRLSGAIGGRTEDGKYGAYLSAVYGDQARASEQVTVVSTSRNIQVDTDGDGVSDGPVSVFAPNNIGYNPIEDDTERRALAAGFQAKLTPNLELVADAAFTSNNRESFRNRALVLFSRSYARETPADNIVIDDNGTLQRFDVSDQFRSPLLRTQPLLFNNKTENFVGGVNLTHSRDRLTQSFDVYYSDVGYTQDLRFSRFQRTNWDQTGVVYDNLGRDVPTVTGLGDNLTNPVGFTATGGVVREIYLDADQTGLAYDLDYELDGGLFSGIEAGLRYSETNLDTIRTPAVAVSNVGLTSTEAAAAALADANLQTGFLDSEDGFEPNSWVLADFNTIGGIQEGLLTLSGVDDLGIDPLASYGIEEDVLSAYVQGRIGTQIGDTPVSGNVGVRVVQTSQGSTGFAIGDGIVGDPLPVEFDSDFTTVLPTLNLKFDVTDKFVVRPSVGRTMSRADYSNLSPRLQVGAVGDDSLLDDVDPDDPATLRRAQAGNPELDPMLAWNYDLTFEYYPADHTAFVVSLFYKDVSDFIIRQTTQTTLQSFGDEEFLVNQPVNFSSGSAEGFEIGVVSDFTFLPAPFDKTGVQANYTYVSSGFDQDVGDAGFGFPGSSENNYNISAYYQDGPLTLRAAYTYRDDYFRVLEGQGSQTGSARFTEGSGRLNLSARYRVLRNVTLGVSAQNVTEEPRRDFVGSETNFLDYFNTGSSVNVTLRAAF